MAGMRDRLRDKIMGRLDEVFINGSWEHRLPGNLNISFAYVEGESLLMGINDIAVSSGSACTSATLEPSYVLKALGTGDDLAHSSIRFGLGRFNTDAEVDYVADRVVETVSRVARAFSALRDGERRHVDLKSVKWAAEEGTAVNQEAILLPPRRVSRVMAYSDKVLDHYNESPQRGFSR
jgi:cysteine desulfurase